jgi:hypothetical protein
MTREQLLVMLLEEAKENLIWCGGSDDFAPDGKARDGWAKGPRQTIDTISMVLNGAKHGG